MIRWIEDKVLGTAAFDQLSANELAIYVVLDVRQLVDKAGNDNDFVAQQIGEGLEILRAGKPLVVACDFGVSRSNAIAAGVLSLRRGIPLDEAVSLVATATGETNIKLAMIESVRQALSRGSERASGSSILITGSTGFLGASLTKALNGEAEVLTPSRSELDLLGPTLELARYCRENAVATVAHLAAPRIYTNLPALGESLVMLKSLVDVCLSLNIRLLHVSESVVFSGYEAAHLEAGLDLPMRPKHIYAETKYLEECLLDALQETTPLRCTRIRLPPVYGPGGDRPRFIRKFSEDLKAGRTIKTHRYANGPARLELTYIDDAVAALRDILKAGRTGRFHIGTGLLYSPADVAVMIAEELGLPIMTEEIAISEAVANVALGCKSDDADFSWAPQVSLEEGLKRTLARFTEAV